MNKNKQTDNMPVYELWPLCKKQFPEIITHPDILILSGTILNIPNKII